ncbi:MAG: YgiQ family radical SAM protein [Clostridia bacterium]|nr:YgiQ family radical SAM protein [Clostridia bacterium]
MFAINQGFLPTTPAEITALGWAQPDFIYVCGDAYVDHPSFGAAIISRVLEAKGYRVAMLCQPNYRDKTDFMRFGRPRLGFLVSAGNIDSMVAHYTVSKKKRNYDYYSPGGKMGLRPDRACIVYSNRIREAYGDVPIILGGLEASLRRFAHYDYWDDKVRRSILVDSRADILTYGMGENILIRIAELLDKGVPVKKIRDVRGTVYIADRESKVFFDTVGEYDYDQLKTDKSLYAKAFGEQLGETDAVNGRAIIEYYGAKKLVQNPPMYPLEQSELDWVYSLPYTRRVHPMYDESGGVPGINEVEFSITHNRGCYGSCSFCALAFHQGRAVRARSVASVLEEAKIITGMPGFKGYIHDVGGPTANFRGPACEKQVTDGVCRNRRCLSPKPCRNLVVDHSEYMSIIERIEALPKVKKVFIRSGIRFDYLMYDSDDSFFRKMVRDNVSGQLKVAPEHCCDSVLSLMGKPSVEVYNAFKEKFFKITKQIGKEQYLVPYLMSSHPGSTLNEAVELALYLKRGGYSPEQVQDFYPTPGTASTVMYYTGIDPVSGKKIYTATDYHEKQMQRALLQWSRPENASLVREALKKCGREDLIGFGDYCLIQPDKKDIPFPLGANHEKKLYSNARNGEKKTAVQRNRSHRNADPRGSKNVNGKQSSHATSTRSSGMQIKNGRPIRKEGWARPKKKK